MTECENKNVCEHGKCRPEVEGCYCQFCLEICVECSRKRFWEDIHQIMEVK